MITLFLIFMEVIYYAIFAYSSIFKKRIAILYVIPLYFIDRILYEPILPGFVRLGVIFILLIVCIKWNKKFYQNNGFALLLVFYLVLLNIFYTSDIVQAFNRTWIYYVLFISLPLIHHLFKKYKRDYLELELYKISIIVLFIYAFNVLASSLLGFYGDSPIYFIYSGVLFGNMSTTHFNVLPIALFYFVYYSNKNKYTQLYIPFSIIIMILTIIPMRRSVIVVLIFFIISYIYILMHEVKMYKKAYYLSIIIISLFSILIFTNLGEVIIERYEQRGLQEREIVTLEESRFFEYVLIYRDMFIEKKYSPIIGYELFNSSGNYGNAILGERSLHSDITSILHASGLIGLGLYLLAIFKLIITSIRNVNYRYEFIFVIFGIGALVVYTFTGRITEMSSTLFMWVIFLLPVLNKKNRKYLYLEKKSHQL
jgi:hypothetical protein